MRWVQFATALVLLTLWVPATAHCHLEHLTGFQFLSCGESSTSHGHQPSDCQDDACASVESGEYRMDEPATLVTPSTGVPLPSADPVMDFTTIPPGSSPFAGPAPPESAPSWRFFQRTALPPRAPSPRA